MHAVVFDFDGLILDTETPVFRSWQECYARYGCPPLDSDRVAAIIGTADGIDLLVPLRERLGDKFDEDEIQGWRRSRRDALLADEAVQPGVERWLRDAEALGLPRAIASSSPRGWVEHHLDRLGLLRRFELLCCYGDGHRAKPAPDLYLAACEGLGVEPNDALAVEDSPNGLAAAQSAGLRCVAVPRGLTRDLRFDGADLVVHSLDDLALADALAQLAA